MSKVCLVTDELFPITHGGCGTLIYNSIYSLLKRGHEVRILADIDDRLLNTFDSNHIVHFPRKDSLRIISVQTLLSEMNSVPEYLNDGLTQSLRFYLALERLFDQDPQFSDIVEFPDYKGYAYHTLSGRLAGALPKQLYIYIRLHLPMEWADDSAPLISPVGENRLLTYGLERWCLAQCDRVLVPSSALDKMLHEHYRVRASLVSPPSLEAMNLTERVPNEKPNIVLFLARLAPQKGAELFIKAAVSWLETDRDISRELRFVIAGPDIYNGPDGGSMSQFLMRLVPTAYRSCFEFSGNVDHGALSKLIPSVLFAVFPTRAETFCYGARELASMGVPIICSDIPALQDLVESGAALSAPLSVDAWTKTMRLFSNEIHTKHSSIPPWIPPPPLSNAYSEPPEREGTISDRQQQLVVVVLNKKSSTRDDIEAFKAPFLRALGSQIVFVEAVADEGGRRIYLRGQAVALSRPVPEQGNAICFAHIDDIFEPGYLAWAIDRISCDPSVSVVTCSRMFRGEKQKRDLPWNVVPELLPFKDPSNLQRAIIKLTPKVRDQCLNSFFDVLNEIAGIWAAIETDSCWIHNEQFVVRCGARKTNRFQTSSLALGALNVLLHQGLETNCFLFSKTLRHLCLSQTPMIDIIGSLHEGKTPELSGVRLNLRNILKMARIRILATMKNFLHL